MDIVRAVVITADKTLAAVGLNAYQLFFYLGLLALYPAVVGFIATRGTNNNFRKIYSNIKRYPFGHWLFCRMFAAVNPFPYTLGFSIEEYTLTRTVLSLPDRQSVRNPVRAIHVGALATLAETAAGLMVLGQLERSDRFLPTQLTCSYSKQARGTVYAVCEFLVPAEPGKYDLQVPVVVRNEAGEDVCHVHVKCRLEIGDRTGGVVREAGPAAAAASAAKKRA